MKLSNITLLISLIASASFARCDKPDSYDEDVFLKKPKKDPVEHRRYIVQYASKSAMKRAALKPKAQQVGKMIAMIERENAEVMMLQTEEEVKAMEDDDDVLLVEKDSKVYLSQSETVPYGIEQVRAPEVSAELVSNRKVCIIDTGYDINHPDLQSDNVTGYRGSQNGNLPWDADGNGHGTHVAGTIAAIGGNGQGVVGVVPNSQLKLHIVRVFNNRGRFVWRSTLVSAVQDCIDAGSNIVSMSLGGPVASQIEADAYKRMTEEDGVLIIAAAGNGSNTRFSYPASYSYVMSVAAVDSDENHARFSQRNVQVSIAAPGVDVRSTVPNGEYRSFSGTSMATPHVAGVAALVWSHFDTLKGEQIRKVLEQSARDKGDSGYDTSYGYGLVDAKAAFDALSAGEVPGICSDSQEGWHDSRRSEYTCAWYSIGRRCAANGNRYANDGLTANEACCACGGGEITDTGGQPSAAPVTSSPTVTPSAAPSGPTPSPSASPSGDSCQDSAERFSVGFGTRDCKWASISPNLFCQWGETAVSCPVTCGADCTCFNTEGTFTYRGTDKTCDWVEGRFTYFKCRRNVIRSNCPISCGVC